MDEGLFCELVEHSPRNVPFFKGGSDCVGMKPSEQSVEVSAEFYVEGVVFFHRSVADADFDVFGLFDFFRHCQNRGVAADAFGFFEAFVEPIFYGVAVGYDTG